jgi:hypothetical protein
MTNIEPEPLWTASQTAIYLGITEIALARLRKSGKGPLFSTVPGRNKYRYRPSVVARWNADREVASVAALNEADAKRAEAAAKQRDAAAHARQTRWKPNVVKEIEGEDAP